MALHEQCVGATDEWYTPKYVFDAMGCYFDLDVASPGAEITPWVPATECLTTESLQLPWWGFAWMNPPFGKRNGLVPWLEKFVEHGNGVCLVPDRTSAPWWQRFARHMESLLFVSPKIKFIDATGRPGCSPAQGTCLMSLGANGAMALQRAAREKLGTLFRPDKPVSHEPQAAMHLINYAY